MPKLTQQQLEAHLWGAANILRGKTAALVEKEKALVELKKSLTHDLLTGRVRLPADHP